MFMTNPVWLFVEIIDFGFLSYQILCSEMLGSLTVTLFAGQMIKCKQIFNGRVRGTSWKTLEEN
ncbi:hypothetical protein PVL29_016197 [Vitis rotundifolia]|uniref:Uncharacterized protein n=1 Tax=Vitis rotundifolia TaxID=103349 RepID=A0AA38ZEW9_VITRO|nr:hypothetical protein PVL29_016197 [Vitis rotundifolia]